MGKQKDIRNLHKASGSTKWKLLRVSYLLSAILVYNSVYSQTQFSIQTASFLKAIYFS